MFTYQNLPAAAQPAMGLWSKPGTRGIVCAQARPKWVVVGLVPTPLLRTFGPRTAGCNPAQPNIVKKAHYIVINKDLFKFFSRIDNAQLFLIEPLKYGG